MFVRNCWYVAAWSHELKSGELIARTLINTLLVLYKTDDGVLTALEDRCCHRFAPLSKGRLEGDGLRCMYHGLKFDRGGNCIEIPGQEVIPADARVRAFPVTDRHGWIWVWMGDPQSADEALIPPAIGLDSLDWTMRGGQLDIAADYQLLNDNLTDFTHVSYVHANSFGRPESYAQKRPNVEKLARGVRVWRWITDGVREDASEFARRRGKGEEWTDYDYLVPGILLMHSAPFPEGTAERFKRQAPDFSQTDVISQSFTSQAVTPMTDRTTRYFFCFGTRKGEGAEAFADQLLQLAYKAFNEDKEMIEAQQRSIDIDPDRGQLLTSADIGPTQMRAAIRRLAAASDASIAAAG